MTHIDFTKGAPRRPRYNLAAICDNLEAHPGQWGAIDEGPTALMHAYASRWRGQMGRHFDFRASVVERGSTRSRLFGIFLGEDPIEAPPHPLT